MWALTETIFEITKVKMDPGTWFWEVEPNQPNKPNFNSEELRIFKGNSSAFVDIIFRPDSKPFWLN